MVAGGLTGAGWTVVSAGGVAVMGAGAGEIALASTPAAAALEGGAGRVPTVIRVAVLCVTVVTVRT